MINARDRLEEGLFQRSRAMGPPWGPALRLLRYPVALIRDWLAGELNVRAMSLAYTTLLSLVPLMVFSFAILKGLGAHGDLRYLLHEFFKPMGSAANQLTESVMQAVSNMRGDVLGSIGLAFLIYTVIATIQKIEGSFNYVWRVEHPRSFMRRFTEYLSVMILGPILLAASIKLLGSAEHSWFAQQISTIAPLTWLLTMTGTVVPYVLVTLVFTFMYVFIPNTRVKYRAALLGGVAAGIMWALVGQVYTHFIVYSSQMLVVYSSFAIVLLTLIWVYLSWLILLIGAQLAFYVQFPQYLRHGQEPIELTGSAREQAGLSVMYLISRDHSVGRNYWTANQLAVELDIPSIVLAPVLGSLERGGLIVATEKEQFVPARDAENIKLANIIDAVRTVHSGRRLIDVKDTTPAASVMDRIEGAMRKSLGDRSLKDLINGV